jgi:hypothetical protein
MSCAAHFAFGPLGDGACKRPINQPFMELFGQQGSVLVPHLWASLLSRDAGDESGDLADGVIQ